MKTIEKCNRIMSFDRTHAPALKCASGETVIFETADCFNDVLTHENQSMEVIQEGFLNPATGPLFIEGAIPGDVLKVEIIDIETGSFGVMTADPYDGILNDRCIEDRIRVIPIDQGFAHMQNGLKLSLKPMIGVIGVAPAEDTPATVLSGDYGGNMDCKTIEKGSVVYLPVFVEGALLAMGDLHAIMGDGETGGCGLEVQGRVTVRVSTLKDQSLPVPMVYSGNLVMTVVTQPSLEDANRIAIRRMHDFLTHQVGIDLYEAKYLLSLAGDLKICQIVDHERTSRMEFPMEIIQHFGYKMP